MTRAHGGPPSPRGPTLREAVLLEPRAPEPLPGSGQEALGSVTAPQRPDSFPKLSLRLFSLSARSAPGRSPGSKETQRMWERPQRKNRNQPCFHSQAVT